MQYESVVKQSIKQQHYLYVWPYTSEFEASNSFNSKKPAKSSRTSSTLQNVSYNAPLSFPAKRNTSQISHVTCGTTTCVLATAAMCDGTHTS